MWERKEESLAEGVDESLAQLKREVKLLSNLRHPNILAIFGVARASNRVMMVMALGARGSLMDVLRKAAGQHGPASLDGGLPWHRRLSIAVGIASGLRFMHSQTPPILHRELPSQPLH